MRLAAVAVTASVLTLAPAGDAKQSNFFRLEVGAPARTATAVCGTPRAALTITSAKAPAATVRLDRPSKTATPFVIALRKCKEGRFVDPERIRLRIPAGKRSATHPLKGIAPGEYRIEALLNGDRPATKGATRYLVVAADGSPRVESATYGDFQPRGADRPMRGLRLRVVDPDGQVVGLSWSQVSPPHAQSGVGIADGGCGVATATNGAVGTFYLPMELEPGDYTYRFTLDASPCDKSNKGESVDRMVGFRVC